MYNPAVGRWMTQDPIEFEAEDADLYRYVRNNPTNLTDPTGLLPFEITLKKPLGASLFGVM
ncbi:MAG: RHS repeat-associated core domain-containing protein [Gemmataceae bacterium]